MPTDMRDAQDGQFINEHELQSNFLAYKNGIRADRAMMERKQAKRVQAYEMQQGETYVRGKGL